VKPFRLRPWIDLEFHASAGRLRARVVERPLLWMPEAGCRALVDDLRHVVHALGIGGLDYGVLATDLALLDRAILTLVYDAVSGEPIAFNAMLALDCTLRGEPVDVIHLGLTVVDPRHRGSGVAWLLTGFTTFLLFIKNGLRPYWISNVSQVPAAIGMVCEATAHVFPSPLPDSRRTFDHLVLAREIMRRHRAAFGVGPEAGFDEDRFVITRAYTGGSDHLKKSYEQAAPHRDERVNAMCRNQLDYVRGDDFLQLGQVNLFTLYRYLRNSLPRDAVTLALSRYVFAFFDSLLVPVVQWLSPSRPMGDLRPWPPRRTDSTIAR